MVVFLHVTRSRSVSHWTETDSGNEDFLWRRLRRSPARTRVQNRGARCRWPLRSRRCDRRDEAGFPHPHPVCSLWTRRWTDRSSVHPPTSLSPCLTGACLPGHLCNSLAFRVVTVVQPHFTMEPLQNLWAGHDFGQNGIAAFWSVSRSSPSPQTREAAWALARGRVRPALRS